MPALPILEEFSDIIGMCLVTDCGVAGDFVLVGEQMWKHVIW